MVMPVDYKLSRSLFGSSNYSESDGYDGGLSLFTLVFGDDVEKELQMRALIETFILFSAAQIEDLFTLNLDENLFTDIELIKTAFHVRLHRRLARKYIISEYIKPYSYI